MTRLFNHRAHTAGLPPGTLSIPEEWAAKAKVSVIDFTEHSLNETVPEDLTRLADYLTPNSVTWINVIGVRDVEAMHILGAAFNLHPLVLEDIVHTAQRPKLEDYQDFLYLFFKMIRVDSASGQILSEQVSLLLFDGVVISFQEREGDVFDAVRDRIRQSKGRVRKLGADYLMYILLDAVVDHYFAVLENSSEQIESIEENLLGSPDSALLSQIHSMKKDFVFLRKAVWPLREALANLERLESPLIHGPTRLFLRDVYDHTIQVIDTIETCRDVLSGLLDIYLSVVSNRMNEVMKVLTIIATIFIPITFVAGIYGMNFESMPELKQPFGYPAALAVMAAIAMGMLLYFRKKDWI